MDIELPVDDQAESAVLARMMGSINTANDAFGALTASDFFSPLHQAVFDAMIALMKANAEIEPLAVLRVMAEKSPKLVDQGYVYGLQGYQSHYTDDATHFIEAVKNCSIYRRLIMHCKEMISKAASKKIDPSVLNSEINVAVDQIFHSNTEGSVHDLHDSYDKIYRNSGLKFLEYHEKKMEDHRMGRCVLSGLPTGYSQIDDILDGFNRGHYIIIGARPGVGKTTFIMNLMRNMAQKGIKIGYLSLEGGIHDALLSYACLDANVEADKFKKGMCSPQQYQDVVYTTNTSPHIMIDDASGLKISQVVSRVRRMVASFSIEVLFIDYLGLIRGDQKYPNRQEEMQQVSGSLRELAKKLNIPIVCVCQLNRESEKANRIPNKSDLRETGQIEADAMSILMLHRPDQVDANTNPGVMNVHIVKNRYGREEKVSFEFKKETGRLNELGKFVNPSTNPDNQAGKYNDYD